MAALRLLLAALSFLDQSVCTLAKVVGAAIVPHGDFAYDPSLVHNQNGSFEVHNAAKAAGRYLSRLEPDIIFLSTPHGVALSNDFAFYQNDLAAGFAAVGGDLHNASVVPYNVPLNVSLDANLTSELLSILRASGQTNVSALSSFANSEPQAIRWGEVIPLTFVEPAQLRSAQLVMLSQPLRRYTAAAEMVPELLSLGHAVFQALDALPLRVALLMSSDLAHTHLASGPYGYSPAAMPFDAAVGKWASSPATHAMSLLDTAARLESRALSCGFTSLVLLHGALRSDWARFGPTAQLLANRAPTYYGMLVAIF